jgi:decaprenylphospho-beta-D-ribofuranose 2-oxidase
MKKNVSNWGNYPVIESDEVLFTQEEQIISSLKNKNQVIARGNGRCYGDASLSKNIIKTVLYDKVLDFDIEKGIFNCQSGITLDQILEIIVPKGWFLPVTPGTKFVTIGGAVASDVHGKNHHIEGCISQHIIDMDLVLANESVQFVSREHTPALFDATCGGMGLTGIISRVKFSLKPIETAYIKQKQIKAKNLDEILELFDEYNHYTYSVAWIDCLSKGDKFGRSILMLGEHARLDEIPSKFKSDPFKSGKKALLTFPIYLPAFVLNKLSIKIFNWLYYNKNLKKIQEPVTHYEPFFYPLDVINDWNKMYGKPGFVQYQFVIPFENGKEGLSKILKKISDKGMGSFLAVLKVFGKQDQMISFPFEGYTLALDFPVNSKLFPFLDELDEIVEAYSGRIYLSKDARMKADFFHRTYSRLDEFKAVLDTYNPDRKISNIQAERLNLR